MFVFCWAGRWRFQIHLRVADFITLLGKLICKYLPCQTMSHGIPFTLCLYASRDLAAWRAIFGGNVFFGFLVVGKGGKEGREGWKEGREGRKAGKRGRKNKSRKAGSTYKHPVCCLCRQRPLVLRRVPVAAGFAWQGFHFGTLSVVCVAGVSVRCCGVFRLLSPGPTAVLYGWICVAGAALGHSASPAAAVLLRALRGRGSAWAPCLLRLHLRGRGRRPVCCLCRRLAFGWCKRCLA